MGSVSKNGDRGLKDLGRFVIGEFILTGLDECIFFLLWIFRLLSLYPSFYFLCPHIQLTLNFYQPDAAKR